jgi:hypothetical protein
MSKINDHLVIIGGKSAGGKSASLMDIEDPTNVMYFNCESGKRLPFPAKFQQFTITDPYQVYEGFDHAETLPDVHTLIVDSQTFLMDMMESVHVIPSADTQSAWGAYFQYFKNLMQVYVARSTKNVIFTAHTLDQLNESEHVMETKIPVKGALKNNGIESYFSLVLAAKRMSLKALEVYSNDLLNITPADEALGLKYVFQTQLTKETIGERIRGPMGMFTPQETFIDNNVQLVMDRLNQYYGLS